MRRFRRPTFVVILGWVAAALVATVAGLGGIRLVGESLTGTPGGVLTEDDVRRALATSPVPTASDPASGDAPAASGFTPPAARPSGPLAARPSAPPTTTAGPPLEGSPGGGPAAPRTTGGPTASATARPDAPRATATSKMGNAPTSPRTTKPAAPRGVEASFSSSGGTAIARCTGSSAFLVSWSPRPGYGVDKVKQGPDDEVEVRFEGDEGRSELKISCGAGTPVAETKEDD